MTGTTRFPRLRRTLALRAITALGAGAVLVGTAGAASAATPTCHG